MAIDVLQTNALRQANKVTRDAIDETVKGALNCYTGFMLKSSVPTPACFCCACCFIQRPTGTTCTLLVGCVRCANNPDNVYSYARCGMCCLWTVPAGVTKAQFEIWAPGAGTGSGCCCGGSVHGPHGAYASIMIDVVPGCQYTLCAGCASCCFAVWGAVPATDSYVTGYGLCNFCAQGGCQYMSTWICHYNGLCSGHFTGMDGGCARYGAYQCSTPCVVNGNDYCFGNSFGISGYNCGMWQVWYDTQRTYYGCSSNTPNAKVFGVPSLWSCICFNTTNHKNICVAPVMGYPVVGTCSYTQTSGNCCGGYCNGVNSGGNSILPFPSVGGFASHAMGGGTTNCGDSGRGGQVRVTYC